MLSASSLDFRFAASHHLLQPVRDGRLGQRYNGVWRTIQVATLAVGHTCVTIPAGFAFAIHSIHVGDHTGVDELLIQLRVTADAVVHDHLIALLARTQRHRFTSQREDGGVEQSIFGLEGILEEYVVMRHMAVVTRCPSPVRTMIPRVVVGRHDVTVDAHRRVVAEIRVYPRHVSRISAKPGQDSPENEEGKDKLTR